MAKPLNRWQVTTAATELLKFLDENKINTILDLEGITKLGRRVFPAKNSDGKIMTEISSSNAGTFVHTVSYIIEGVGIPVEFKINPMLGYATIIAKAEFNIPEYKVFARDYFGNIMQAKRINSINPSEVRRELEQFSEY
ncbi:hypothetical protein KY308_04395 [Candidatus Woesearchaeota archaeon]|nr:hypothetical protein [Candidatus Woesearchaeota archaeon]